MTHVVLRLITKNDTEDIVRWRNKDSVKKNLYTQNELTAEQHEKWLKTKVMTGSCVQFIIEIHSKDSHMGIGTVFIKNIDIANSKGEFGIFIGEENARGKGYATIATSMILDHAFKSLNLNRIYLTVFSDNLAAIRAYEKAGFLIEGILRQDFHRYDGFVDVTCMGITIDKWKTSNKHDNDNLP
jgi:UDP-4-amino-4,6-dideoxy-N-acetyl-beta-L-altrosamine N-acetyltransferase